MHDHCSLIDLIDCRGVLARRTAVLGVPSPSSSTPTMTKRTQFSHRAPQISRTTFKLCSPLLSDRSSNLFLLWPPPSLCPGLRACRSPAAAAADTHCYVLLLLWYKCFFPGDKQSRPREAIEAARPSQLAFSSGSSRTSAAAFVVFSVRGHTPFRALQ